MRGNDVVAWFLRTPLFPLLGSTMLISVRGRRTGRLISTPVNYVREGKALWVLSNRGRTWWRNIDRATPVELRLQGHDTRAVADLILDEASVRRQLASYVVCMPAAAASLGIHLRNGVPDSADLEHAAAERLFVRVQPVEPPDSAQSR